MWPLATVLSLQKVLLDSTALGYFILLVLLKSFRMLITPKLIHQFQPPHLESSLVYPNIYLVFKPPVRFSIAKIELYVPSHPPVLFVLSITKQCCSSHSLKKSCGLFGVGGRREGDFHSFFFFFSTFIYLWDRERQSMNGGGAEREGDTESGAGSRL